MEKTIQIHADDNVAVAVSAIAKGEECAPGVHALADVPAGHKIALHPIKQGECIVKYGFPIGTAKEEIAAGAWVHSHNVKSRLGDLLEYTYAPNFKPLDATNPRQFDGYRRPDGSVGVRNEVWIVPTVGCVNAIAKLIEQASQKLITPEIDGIYCYSHPYGCSQLGDDHHMTQKALAGIVRHPNAGAVLVLGLGCENNNIGQFKEVLGEYNPDRVKFLNCQDYDDEVGAAMELMEQLCKYASQFRREPCGADQLVIGLKCGGSDGFSGITANPLAGAFSNLLVAQGGTSMLTEVPEMFGAETLLMNRCKDEATFQKTVALINNFKQYFMNHGEKVDENPSPGNKAGGITTLEDKSLGCVQKGGSAPVSDVLSYGDPVREHGLNLLQGPGNDLVASTALAISGAHIVLFTTGRGTPFACPVPTIKISSNSELAKHKSNWIDFDAGRLLHGEQMDALADEFFNYVLDVASGKKHAKSEALDKRDLPIFKDGVTL